MATCSISPMVVTAEELFQQNIGWARAIARNIARKLPPSFDPGDLEQEALIETWKRAERFDGDNERGTPFRAYAYMAVRGAVLMSIRRRAWKEGTAEEISRDAIDTGMRPDERIHHHQVEKAARRRHLRRKAWLLEAIEELPPVDAFLVKRVYCEGAEVENMADMLGMERRAASRRLAGVVKRLIKTRREG